LEAILTKINAFDGEKSYQENQAAIDKLKQKSIALNSTNYKKAVANQVQARIDMITDKIGTPNEALISKLEQLKNTGDANEITRLEGEINRELGKMEADIVLDKLINELRAIVKKGKNGADVAELNKKLAEIKEFSQSTNTYQQQSYSQQKSQVEQLISQAQNLNQQETKNDIAP